MRHEIHRIAAVLLLALLSACGDGHLRGSVTDSPDGKTYLAVIDVNNGACRPLMVDGEEWPYAPGEKGEVEPGVHTISCIPGLEIQFEIPEGVVFSFDYWGP